VKILTTAGGEATSDYLKTWGNIKGGGTEIALFVVGLIVQFGTRRYRAFAYWFLAFAIAIFGTGGALFLTALAAARPASAPSRSRITAIAKKPQK